MGVEQKMSQKGFTLIEMMMAIIILGIAIVPLMEMISRASITSSTNEQETRIVFLAQQKLEQVKSLALTNFTDDYTQAATAFPSPDLAYKYTIYYYTSGGDDGNLIKSIRVRAWYDSNSNNSADTNEPQLELNTKVAKRA